MGPHFLWFLPSLGPSFLLFKIRFEIRLSGFSILSDTFSSVFLISLLKLLLIPPKKMMSRKAFKFSTQ